MSCTPWHFGNTSVRSAMRLREGLIALKQSGIEGNIRGMKGDKNLREALGRQSVVSLGEDVTNSVGRKWRSAMEKLGFIYPHLKGEDVQYQEQVGPKDYISESGLRLIGADAENFKAQQECFLRALAAYYIPNEDEELCSPFIFILKVLLRLESISGESKLSMIEMATIVQCHPPSHEVNDVISKITAFRESRNLSERKRAFDRTALERASEEFGVKEGTFKDYADTNFRYLKATGLISAKGKVSIALVPEKKSLIHQLLENEQIPENRLGQIKRQCQGAILPTDNKDTALIVFDELLGLLSSKGESYDTSQLNRSSVADIEAARHEVERKLFCLKEIEYAAEQKNQVQEILAFFEILNGNYNSRNKISLDEDLEIIIPKGEAPAYFEWALWRAFLAINSLSTPPWDARRFQIDQDFLPVSTAPGRGADLIIELEDMVIVAEVTLTASSRQEAAEGEPVRRHVADVVEKFQGEKAVYGLFMAVNIDTNTANTFRLGEWYTKSDEKLLLDIVPLRLDEFKGLLEASSDEPHQLLPHIKELFEKCRKDSQKEAPIWKAKIAEHVTRTVKSLSS